MWQNPIIINYLIIIIQLLLINYSIILHLSVLYFSLIPRPYKI